MLEVSTLKLNLVHMATVYILFPPSLNKFYTGSCENIENRLFEHKNKKFKHSFTSITNDWLLYFSIENIDGVLARKIEAHIKAMKSKNYIENLKAYPEMTAKLISKFSDKL